MRVALPPSSRPEKLFLPIVCTSHQIFPDDNLDHQAKMFSRPLWHRRGKSSIEEQRKENRLLYPPERRHIDEAPDSESDTTMPSFLPPFRRYHLFSAKQKSIRSKDRRADPQGLCTIFTPSAQPSADIIFVHGLGGSSRLTWAKNHELSMFWPLEWLPLEEEISSARIFSFGYDAQFASQQKKGVLSISDFAKDLLYQLRYPPDEDVKAKPLGKRPIIFVVHSMGGLVFKKAFLYGQHDDSYQQIIASIRAVIFLSTPHQGTHLADTLNKLLSASLLYSPQQFIAQMDVNSPYLAEINEEFRNVAPRLQIFSFYETQPTLIAGSQIMIVKKSAAVLGYPGEVSKPLGADHHGVCKFDSTQDINYRSVRSVLQSLLAAYKEEGDKITSEECRQIEEFLHVHTIPEYDLKFFLSRWNSHTCRWILQNNIYQRWVETPNDSAVVWLHGKPGRGKSVLSSYLIQTLSDRDVAVQYFFFRFGEQVKNSVAFLLRSLALQLSQSFSVFRKSLLRLKNSRIAYKNSDWQSIWEHIFKNLLFKVDLGRPIYWIIDGLDECETPNPIFDLLSTISASSTPIRVLLVSRWSTSLSVNLDGLGKKAHTSVICADESSEDISIYAKEELAYLPWSPDLKKEVVQRIADRANGSFLWVHLALEDVKNCHTMKSITSALNELPNGMESLYERMVTAIARSKRDSATGLQRCLFIWTIYTRTSITIDELCQALEPEWSLLDLKFTIGRLCGHFLIIEDGSRVGLIHETAREYLKSTPNLPFSLEPSQAHYEIFKKSMLAFKNPRIHFEIDNEQRRRLLAYRVTFWAYHLCHVSDSSHFEAILCTLVEFFSGASVLVWIQVLACLDNLSAVIETSRRLFSFIQRLRKASGADNPQYRRLAELELVQLWARDLLKIVGKFGSNLLFRPTAIYDSVLPFCPRGSGISKTFQSSFSHSLTVRGLPEDWDDCLSRVTLGRDHRASRLICSGKYLAIMNTANTVTLWDCETFEEIGRLRHDEYVYAFCFSHNGEFIASYGLRTTSVWAVESQKLQISTPSIHNTQAMAFAFAENDTLLMMGSDNHGIFTLSFLEEEYTWTALGTLPLEKCDIKKGEYMNSPTTFCFSHDRTKVVTIYRRFPLTIWSLNPMKALKKAGRVKNESSSLDLQPYAYQVQWHPNNNEVLGIFADGSIFKCSATGNFQYELEAVVGKTPIEIQCSPDGRLFATSDTTGTIRIHDYDTFSQLYELSGKDLVTGMCFSYDSKRFYDIRRNYCNVWEPNVLIRLSETDNLNDSYSDCGSMAQSNIHSEAYADMSASITAVCATEKLPILCTGNDDGVVEIHNYAIGDRKLLGHSRMKMPIEILAWSKDCKFFAYADLGRKITLHALQVSRDGSPSLDQHEAYAEFNSTAAPSMVKQLLFSADGTKLLIAFIGETQIWSIKTCSLLTSHSNEEVHPWRWVRHSAREDVVLSITSSRISAHKWHNLSEIYSFDIQTTCDQDPKHSHGPGVGDEVTDAFLAHSKAHIILTISHDVRGRLKTRFAILHLNLQKAHGDGGLGTVNQIEIPDDVATQIEKPLNVLGADRLIFIDRSFWVCSWNLDSVGANLERHFFLPRDWINLGNLSLLHLTETGAIICPRRGELAVVESSLFSTWC